MKSLLVHEKTKDELTTYLASKSFRMLSQMTSVSLLLAETKPRPHTHTQGNWKSLRLPRRSRYQTKPCIVLMVHREVPHLLGFKHPCNKALPKPLQGYKFCHRNREISLAPIYNDLGAMKAASLPGFRPGGDIGGHITGHH